jgi:hypothetical protein
LPRERTNQHQWVRRRLKVGCLIALIFLFLCDAVAAQNEGALQSSLAKAYLYILSYTRWLNSPADQSDIVFCVNRGHNLFDLFSDLLPTKKIHGRKIVLRFFEADDVNSLAQCNVIALSKDDEANKTVIKNIQGKPILTMSDETDITRYGGIVFLAHDQKLQPPKIDIAVMRAAQLSIDASILDLSVRKWGGMP